MKVDARMMKRVRIDPKPVAYQRLDGEDESKGEHVGVPKGYVPVLVGCSEERVERFVIPIKLFKHPCMLALLKMAEEEFGYEQPGVLNIPCDVGYFQRVGEHVGVPKGYVPVLVGCSEERVERFVIPIKLFKHPCMLALLKMAEEEFGYEQPGVLNIPCDVGYFQRVIDMISTSKAK